MTIFEKLGVSPDASVHTLVAGYFDMVERGAALYYKAKLVQLLAAVEERGRRECWERMRRHCEYVNILTPDDEYDNCDYNHYVASCCDFDTCPLLKEEEVKS